MATMTAMFVQRINRMVLGVAAPVARFAGALTGSSVVDLDDPAGIDAAADLLIVGRQQHHDDGRLRLGFEVLEAAGRRVPRRVIYVLPDRFTEARYARDMQGLIAMSADGRRILVLELGSLRELGDEVALGRARPQLASDAPGVFDLLSGRSLAG